MKDPISDKDLRELKRIHETIPEDLKKRLVIKRAVTPTMAKMLSLAMHQKDIDPERLEKLQTIKDAGILDQKEEVINRSVEKKISKYLDGEIIKSVKAGRLSKPPQKSELSKHFKYE
jgi:predicted urease superfamily metal-dependent hydrolase